MNHDENVQSERSRLPWLLFAVIFLAAIYLRGFGFFLPSDRHDSAASQSLAMKLNHGFMKHYDIYHYKMEKRDGGRLVDYVWEENPRLWRSRAIRKDFHLPLHMQPPLYPIMIWLSHGVFNRGLPYTSVSANLGRDVLTNPPWNFMRAQFYAVIIPASCSLLTIVLVYLFCLRFFSYREGLLAGVLLAFSPVDIAISSRVYSDGVLVMLVFACFFSFLLSLKTKGKKSLWLAALAGTFLALAYLTKFVGVIVVFAWLWAIFWNPNIGLPWRRRFLDRRLLVAAGVSLLIVLPWHLLVWKTYHSLLPPNPVDLNSPWHSFVFRRPAWAYLAGMIWFLPPLALGWAYGFLAIWRPRKHFFESSLWMSAAIFLAALIVLLKVKSAGLEHRYLLPAYPPIAILTGRVLVRVTSFFRTPWRHLSYLACLLILSYFGWRAYPIGWSTMFRGLTEFKPWGV